MSSSLDSTNPHGIRVVANRAPLREDVQAAFLRGSRKATAGIDHLTRTKGRSTTTMVATGRKGTSPSKRTQGSAPSK